MPPGRGTRHPCPLDPERHLTQAEPSETQPGHLQPATSEPATFLGFVLLPGGRRRLPEENVRRFRNRLRGLRDRRPHANERPGPVMTIPKGGVLLALRRWGRAVGSAAARRNVISAFHSVMYALQAISPRLLSGLSQDRAVHHPGGRCSVVSNGGVGGGADSTLVERGHIHGPGNGDTGSALDVNDFIRKAVLCRKYQSSPTSGPPVAAKPAAVAASTKTPCETTSWLLSVGSCAPYCCRAHCVNLIEASPDPGHLAGAERGKFVWLRRLAGPWGQRVGRDCRPVPLRPGTGWCRPGLLDQQKRLG